MKEVRVWALWSGYIDLGEMDAKLLKKIEELTLHLFEQNKRFDEQQKEIAFLKSNINSRFE